VASVSRIAEIGKSKSPPTRFGSNGLHASLYYCRLALTSGLNAVRIVQLGAKSN